MSYEQTNDDLLYIEDGYLTPDGYYVYIALGQVAMGPYIDEGYIEAGYYDDYSAQSGLVCDAEIVSGQVVEASGSWTSESTLSATVTRIKDAESAQASEFTQSASAGRILQGAAEFTDAFTPSLTATAFKNHTALLESQATMSTDAVANRATSITLETIGNLNSQAVKTVDIISAQTSTTTQSTTGTSTTDITQDLNTTAALSADVFNVQFGSATFSSTATVFASRNLGTGRPRSFSTSGTVSFTGSSKFGTHALVASSGGDNHAIASATPDYNRFRTIDLWVNTTAPGGGGGVGLVRTSVWELSLMNQATPGGYRIRFNKLGLGNAQTAVLSDTGWVHLRLIREASAFTLYVNGVRQTWSSNTIANTDLTAANDTLLIGNQAFLNSQDSILDELLITRNLLNTNAASTITVPSAAWTFDDQSNVLILSHFDNQLDDDVTLTQTITRTLTSSAQLSVIADANTKQASATLTALSEILAPATKVVDSQAALVSESQQVTDDLRIRFAAVDMTSTTTVTALIGSIKEAVCDTGSLFTPSVDADAQLAGVALLESQTTQTTVAQKTTEITASQTVTADLSLSITLTAGASIAAFTVSTQTTQADRIRLTSSDLATDSTVAAEAYKIQSVDADLAIEATAAIQADRIRGLASAISATATATSVVGVIKQFSTFYAGNRTAKTVTTFGNAVISTDQAKFGSGSALITDTGDYFTISGDSTLYNGNFTVEMWVWGTNLTQTPNGTIWDNRTSSSNGFYLYVSYGSIGLYEGINGKGLTSAGFNNSQWNHIAVVRNSTNAKVFVNGVQKISAMVTTTNYSNRTSYIGSNYLGAVPLRGYYDEVRLSSNARYTTSFTPTAQAFVDDATTQALLHLDSDFSDDISAFDGIVSSTTLIAETANTIGFEIISTVSTSMTTSAVKTASAQSSAQADFTQTTQAVKTASAVIEAGSLFTPSVDADAQLAGVALLESTSTVTVIIGSIKQFEPNRVIGTATPTTITQSGVPFRVQGHWQPGLVVSVWAKRDLVTTGYEPIWSLDYSDGIGLIIVNNRVYLRQNFDPDEPQANWSGTADTNWHHYLLLMTRKELNYQYFKLWIDGVYKGESSIYDVNNQLTPSFSNDQLMTFGEMTIVPLDLSATLVDQQMQGAVAQIWVGEFTGDQFVNFTASYFYDDGYRDLAQGQGQFNELPQPYFYDDLNDPNNPASLAIPQPDLQAYSDLDVKFIGVYLFAVTMQAQVTQTTQGSARRGITDDLTAEFQLATATGGGVFGGQCQASTTATLNLEISKITGYSTDLTSVSEILAAIGFIKLFEASLTSEALLDASVDVKPPIRTEAFLTATATVTADVSSFTDSVTLMVSFGELTVDATLIPPIRTEALLISEFTVTATIGAIEQFAVLTASTGTMIINAAKTTGTVTDLTTVSDLTCDGQQFKGIIETFRAFNAVLTQGEVINIDPYLQLKIPAETRMLRILPESRLLRIDSESRVLYINKRTQQ